MANQVDIRKVNNFLRKNGLDPAKFRQETTGKLPVLTRKKLKTIQNMAADGKRVLVYLKDGKFVVRDADRKFNFQDKEKQAAARLKGIEAKKAVEA